MWEKIEIHTIHLFPILDQKLNELLCALSPEEWEAPTIAKLWKVKDVAAHLLDGNLRLLSTSRDAYFGEKPENIHSYQDLLHFLNGLNMSWTNAMRRLSPRLLTSLLELTGKEYYEHLQGLAPFEQAVFSVAWAGQDTSPNWFHIAREYTEKFLHQQQIRDALRKPGIMTRPLFFPFISTLMYAFPQAFREVPAESGTCVSLEIETELGGVWSIVKSDQGWQLQAEGASEPQAQVSIAPDVAWKLFSRSWKAAQVIDKVQIKGNAQLGKQVLEMASFMA